MGLLQVTGPCFTEVVSVAQMDECIRTTLGPVSRLLDVGCGIRPQAVIRPIIAVGLDAFRPYLEAHLAGRFWKGSGPACNRLVQADVMEGLPFRDGVFDIVWASDLIEHLPCSDGWRFLTEARRVARRGVIIRTPLGLLHQDDDGWGLGGKEWQTHRSGWYPGDLTCPGSVAWVIPARPRAGTPWARQGWFGVWRPS